MRWRTLPVELFLLAFLGVFLVYPLLYIFPGSASEEVLTVSLTSLGDSPESRAGSVRLVAARANEQALHAELFGLLASPVNVEFLQFFPSIEQAMRDECGVTLTFILRELVS